MAEVEEAISYRVQQGRSLTLGLILSLHGLLFRGVDNSDHPVYAGRLRPPHVKIEVTGLERMSPYIPESWRLEAALTELLEDADKGRLAENYLLQAARFHYRFVKMHPFCDGNGRMARAISLFLVARELPGVLRSRRPVNKILYEHRDDYVNALKYSDGIYADLAEDSQARELGLTEAQRLRSCEAAFAALYMRAVTRSMVENVRILEMELRKVGVPVEFSDTPPEETLDMRFESPKAMHGWDAKLKAAMLEKAAAELAADSG